MSNELNDSNLRTLQNLYSKYYFEYIVPRDIKEDFAKWATAPEPEVDLYKHFGWEGLTHDDDYADLSMTEINEQGLDVTLQNNR